MRFFKAGKPVWPIVAALFLAFSLVSPVLADQETHQVIPLAGSVIRNACSGENINITSGEIRTDSRFHLDEDGGVHSVTHVNFSNVQGTGVDSGATYTLHNNILFEFNSHAGLERTESRKIRIIGQGGTPDFFQVVTFHITINPQGEITSEKFEFSQTCK